MHRTITTILSALSLSASCLAGEGSLTVSEIFCSMPDSIMPYMHPSQRKELIDIKRIEPDSIASCNTTLGIVSLTRLSDDILTLKLSDNSRIEIGRLDDDHFLFITTYGAPLQESRCTVYNKDWSDKRTLNLEEFDIPTPTDSTETIEEIVSNAEFILVSATITDNPQELCIRYNIPLMYSDDKQTYEKHRLQRNVKWNGKTFN